MPFEFKVTPSFRDVAGRFAKAEQALLDSRLPMMRELAEDWVDLAGQEAPGGSGHTVAREIGYTTFTDTDGVGFRGTFGQTARWHIEGTGLYGPRGAVIRPIRANALRFDIGGETLFRKSVRGIRPNAFPGRAYRRWLPGAREALRRMALRYSRTLASGTVSGQI